MVETPEAVSNETTTEGRARWSRLAALGLTLAAFGPLMMLIGGLLWGLEIAEDVGFFGGTAAIGLVGAALVLRFGTWSKFVGIIAGLLLAMGLFWTAFGLFTPNSFFDFVPGLLVIPGALIAIVSCIKAILAARRGEYDTVAGDKERRGMRIVLGVVILLAVVSAGLTFTGRSSVAGEDAELTVRLSDFEFDSSSYQVAGGTSVVIRNDDPFLHSFTVDELGIDESIAPGSEVLVEIPEDAGTYVVYCKPHTSTPDDPGSEDMASELTVR